MSRRVLAKVTVRSNDLAGNTARPAQRSGSSASDPARSVKSRPHEHSWPSRRSARTSRRAAYHRTASRCCPRQAMAGRLVATGHDADSHCSGYDNSGQCHFIATAVNYVRAGSDQADAAARLLDRPSASSSRSRNALGAAVANSPRNTICPTDAPASRARTSPAIQRDHRRQLARSDQHRRHRHHA